MRVPGRSYTNLPLEAMTIIQYIRVPPKRQDVFLYTHFLVRFFWAGAYITFVNYSNICLYLCPVWVYGLSTRDIN